ncbi:hypothetical protein EDB85DRAFT_2277331 [Lactarius pseudohatsudake]|nr:hypothetical protein EDB85DRAFT_2277331 [Lactarius pseudohatsudake]
MAAARDLEHGQISSTSRRPSPSRNPGRGPRDAEPQGGPSQLRVDVTVLRAEKVPRLKNVFGLKFFVTVASQAIEQKTPSVPAKRRTARWGESLDAFILQPSTPLILRLYAERFARRDILIGAHEMIPAESQIEKLRSPLWPRSPRIPLDLPSPPALLSHLLPIAFPAARAPQSRQRLSGGGCHLP